MKQKHGRLNKIAEGKLKPGEMQQFLDWLDGKINERGQPVLDVGHHVIVSNPRWRNNQHLKNLFGVIREVGTYNDGLPDGTYRVEFIDGSHWWLDYNELTSQE